jgi:DNA-binding transcriptional regulator YhcF (GntR family)
MTANNDDSQSPNAGRVPSFVQISSALLYSGVEPDALHLYLILLDKSWKTGCCWPSNRTIGGWLGGKSPDTVDRIFKKLEARGLIVRTAVPATEANLSGRLITVNGRVRPLRKSAEGGSAKKHLSSSANLRHDLIQEEKKEYGPPAPGTGAAPEQSIEEQIAELRVMAETHSLRSMREMAARRIAELETRRRAPRMSGSM